jgi:hypothetical protein
MKCDVCGEELANSEEVKAHKEREHPLDERNDDEKLPTAEPSDVEVAEPEVVVRPVR